MLKNHLYKALYGLILFSLGLTSCKKEEISSSASDFIISSSVHAEDQIKSAYKVDISGGKDTLYVLTDKEFSISSETADPENWISVEKVEKVSNSLYHVILDIKPLEETFELRTSVLSLITEDLNGGFVTVTQGYTRRFSDNFSWLRYGVVNPLDEGREVLMQSWTSTQLANGWTSTVGEDQEAAYVYGRFEHVKLGKDNYGADFISRNIGGIEKDSILVLSFNAVAYAPLFGEPDNNKLTVELQNGCQFEDGTTSQTIALNHFDSKSALVEQNLWNNSFHYLYIKKPETNTVISTIRVRFVTGNSISSPANRIFLDNFNIYSVHEFETH